MREEKVKYSNRIAEAKEKYQKASPKEKEMVENSLRRGVERWILMWDIIKAIEQKFNIDVMGLVREEIWKHSLSAGQRLAKKYKKHGLEELYDAYNSYYEGLVEADWLEFNDKVLHKWNHKCPNLQHFRNLGKTDDEIKEIAPYYCLQDIGVMVGFNPKFEVFPQTRLLMLGDSHCTYRVEDHGGK